MTAARTTPRVLRFETLGSTNDEAARQLAAGLPAPYWIVADEQTRGRGRGGRIWQSPRGNLYATLAMTTSVSAAIATQLSFVAALATHGAASRHIPPSRLSRLRLKWPNDLMMDDAKLAGVLLESLPAPKGGLAVLLGMGMNVAEMPSDMHRPVACLGLPKDAIEIVFASLAAALDEWLTVWNDGRGFAQIRSAWLERAMALNTSVSVNLNGSAIRGKFLGVDPAGALQLETGPGIIVTVTAGDMYPDPAG